MIAITVFWTSLFFLLYSYLLYPIVLRLICFFKEPIILPTKISKFPSISILVPAHNEEKVIEDKILSIYNTDYPLDNIEVIIASDCSTDRTNRIINNNLGLYPNLRLVEYRNRKGKIGILNDLVPKCNGEIVVITDANVFLKKETLKGLVSPFSNKEIGLVDSRMTHKEIKKNGISFQENSYIAREVRIKNMEGKLWGTMMGPFGGCFAMRKKLFSKVPHNYLVDDFYLNMVVLRKGYKAVNNLNAIVTEDVSNKLKEEFKRKVRIATGNFQNLESFSGLVFSFCSPLSFCFLSHKVIRWFGPFIIIDLLWSNIYLAFQYNLYLFLMVFQLLFYFIPIIDYLLQKIKIHIIILRFVTHFTSMNLALLSGFLKYIKGVDSNVWQPTKRNQ